MTQATPAPFRLTSLAHGGGCGCKIAPGVLANILRDTPMPVPPSLIVGADNNEDAAVWRLNDHQALVATTDFFTPIVDNPRDFGRIAATNAISDVYAMGATPIFALGILGMPIATLSVDVIRQITEGGASVCAQAGIPIAGGHSIDTVEPIYGLVVLGLVDPARVKRNNGARPGDRLILGKPLGVGILSAAFKQEKLDASGYERMLDLTTRLNRPGVELARLSGVHAMTDVTGFGLAGHLLEMCRGARVRATLDWNALPFLREAVTHVQARVFTGASTRNWSAYGQEVHLPDTATDWHRQLLADPQTSGGLLVACDPAEEADVLGIFRDAGFEATSTIGEVQAGSPGIDLIGDLTRVRAV
jgi:selenide,water dikinase